ncbi:MAG TPA: 4-hydroxyphenylpyruvate dioxygenase [Jatrophihabitans sp.]|nr:4-hydroxyphenylpyruvate dioxygenase [Jatrophihabitans sp.]
MNIHGIDHIELFVGDAQQSAFYYSAAFGFTVTGQGGPETGLVGQRSLLMTQAGINLVLTSGLYPEHPATEYVLRHGDGVAVIAMETDDVAASFDELVSRGAQPLSHPQSYSDFDSTVIVAEVAGFGDVIHRLVERRGPGGLPIRAGVDSRTDFLPGAIQPVATPPILAEPLVQLIDHFAVCVPAGELRATVEFYQRVFDFDNIFSEYIQVAGQGMNSTVVQSKSGLVTYTVIEPDTSRRPGQIDDFLHWHGGAGVQHVALITDDIVSTVGRFSERGVRFLKTPASYYETLEARVGAVDAPVAELGRLGILVDRDHWGQLLQIFAESSHVRRTFFMEVIERRGARLFGSGNIKALYEAKEREMVHAPTPLVAQPDAQTTGV